ncbi:hypothetical protein AC578_10576 [Pseudocercospora eumusae]|uniref:histidine kinase n=1 Tax=Pseudocercospora eumusae TaxID=321146 RepID=A0A139HKI3_9PEZI|nr:hypothetical protein AC578_10576 [Pseudocercospora eumusae]
MPYSLQTRETQRYYQPWLAAHGSSLNVAKHVDSLAQLDLHKRGYSPIASRDRSLTAFAQLVAIRLDVRRCMVSLIDATNQYILAEATRTHSVSGGFAEDGDELWLGSSILARADAVCEHSMYSTCSGVEADGRTYTTAGMIVNDCRLDDRFSKRPYVVSEPGVRFYAGVPLQSRTGYMIGALAVSNDAPRDGLSADELRYMQEVAQSAMEHLEWARDRVDRFKGERIVRGMAQFIDDCSSLRDGQEGEKSRQPTPHEQSVSSQTNTLRAPRPGLAKRVSSRNVHTQSNKPDGMSRMFASAAEILRDSTIADGCAIFGSTADSGRNAVFKQPPNNYDTIYDRKSQPSPASDSDRHETGTSDSDSSPSARPCKLMAFSVADQHARTSIEDGTALTVGTLDKYFALFPQGRSFSFNDEGKGISSEEESNSEREVEKPTTIDDSPNARAKSRNRKRHMDHKELLKKIPGAKTVVFLPLYDHSEEKLVAGCFLWSSTVGRISLDADLSHLRAFSNCIIGEVIRMNMQRNEAAKTTFIASMSHELRSPLHGILGAAEFLAETTTDAYSAGLVTSIVTCGKTLLDTLNHVLDYSKINKLGKTQMRRRARQNKPVNLSSDSTLESLNMTADVDLGILVEEVAEAVTAGHTFKKLPGATALAKSAHQTSESVDTLTNPSANDHARDGVSVLLDISPRRSWIVRIQPGALRRIIMNLLGNALKYTSSGFVAVSLRAQESSDSSKINALIRVVDSGKGMSESFQRDKLFVPFSQEDPFQPGTGLGLSIVKQIVDSLGGSVQVHSELDVGTEIDIHLSLTAAHVPTEFDANGLPVPDSEMIQVERLTKGKHLVILDPADPRRCRVPTHRVARFHQTIKEVCTNWFGMRVTRSTDIDVDDADLYVFGEPPPLEKLADHHHREGHPEHSKRIVPIVIICENDQDAITMTRHEQETLRRLGKIVEVMPQPCGPRKLAKAFVHCLQRAEDARARLQNSDQAAPAPHEAVPSEESAATNSMQPNADAQDSTKVPPSRTNDLRNSVSSALSYPATTPIDPLTPSLRSPQTEERDPIRNVTQDNPPLTISEPDPLHLLLVDDNKINRQLLVMFMKKCKFTYLEAENGQEALDLYRSSISDLPNRKHFDFVLMDISMPIMDGMEATRRIRDFEKENGVKRVTVIALTGLASEKAREEAETSGIDVFLPKPVKFGELRKLLMQQAG